MSARGDGALSLAIFVCLHGHPLIPHGGLKIPRICKKAPVPALKHKEGGNGAFLSQQEFGGRRNRRREDRAADSGCASFLPIPHCVHEHPFCLVKMRFYFPMDHTSYFGRVKHFSIPVLPKASRRRSELLDGKELARVNTFSSAALRRLTPEAVTRRGRHGEVSMETD